MIQENLFASEKDLLYEDIYKDLKHLRELFHSEGTIEDSNAKLDEMISLITLIYKTGTLIPDDIRLEDSQDFLKSLIKAYERIEDNYSIISSKLQEESDRIVHISLKIVGKIVESYRSNLGLDFVNEIFGHFIRDNFRGNIEDAQYMTPLEVAQFMGDLVAILTKEKKDLIILDPSCGVGSLLIESARSIEKTRDNKNVYYLGQDRVQRMCRLAHMNLELASISNFSITNGNSLSREINSLLMEYDSKIDVIITNPPFGAKIRQNDTKESKKEVYISSELAFLQSYMDYLKPGGLLIAIVPDSTISSHGENQITRNDLLKSADLISVIDLPGSTFAQAGTRTKTSIIVLKKHISTNKSINHSIFGVINHLGFNVKSRKGVNVKIYEGINESLKVIEILKIFLENGNITSNYEAELIDKEHNILSVPKSLISNNSWKGYEYLSKIGAKDKKSDTKLKDIGEIISRQRSMHEFDGTQFFISVLHVIYEGVLDYKELFNYKPITPGRLVKPGDVIFSRLNPRNIRAVVVPNLGKPILCSNEFEIFRPRGDYTSYDLLFVLYSIEFYNQVIHLTSGSSSSHNRVKSSVLSEINITIPKDNDYDSEIWKRNIATYTTEIQNLNLSLIKILELKS